MLWNSKDFFVLKLIFISASIAVFTFKILKGVAVLIERLRLFYYSNQEGEKIRD